MISILPILFATFFTCAGQLCQKKAALVASDISKWHILFWLILAILFLGCGMAVWLWVLQITPVNIAYPMLSLNFVWITLAAKILWKESITLQHWSGIALIIVGTTFLVASY